MEKTTSGFYIIDVLPLKTPSSKPHHIARRIANRRRPRSANSGGNPMKALAVAESRRAAFLEERKEKLATRLGHVLQVVEKHKQGFEAEKKRQRELLNKKLHVSNERRKRFLTMPKTELERIVHSGSELEDQEMIDSHVVEAIAAALVQNWWRKMKLGPAIRTWKRAGLTNKRMSNMPFDTMIKAIQSDTLIKTVTVLIAKVKKMTGGVANYKNPARVFLSAFIMHKHPSEIIGPEDRNAQEVMDLATVLVSETNALLRAYMMGSMGHQLGVFWDAWIKFYESFEAWKSKDTENLVDGMIAHWIELERMWITVKDQPGSEIEFKPTIEKQQQQIQARLAKFGDAAIEKLKKAMAEIRGEENVPAEVVPSPRQIPSKRHKKSDSVTLSPRFSLSEESLAGSSSTDAVKQPEVKADKNANLGAAFGMTNEQLAHELVMDPDFELKPPQRHPFEEQVRQVAKKAFFDSMREDFAKGQYEKHLPGMLQDIHESLLSMVPPNGKFAADLKEHLDVEFIKQQVSQGVFNPEAMLHYITSKMLQLCAPMRDSSIRAIGESKDIVEAFASVLEILDHMKLDLANFNLQQLKPYLKQQAVEYEQQKFDAAVEQGQVTLDKTAEWLETAAEGLKNVAAQRNPENIDIPENRIRYEEVYHEALLSLIFGTTPVALETCPETLLLDAGRLFGFQNEAQAITIVAALIMMSKASIPEFARDELGQKELKERLFLLLKDGDTTVSNIAVQIIERINASLARQYGGSRKLSEEQEKLVHNMVDKTLSFKDTVYSMLNRRVQSHIKTHLTTGTFKREQMVRSGLEWVGTELEDLSRRILLLSRHNKEVYAKHYDGIISKLLF